MATFYRCDRCSKEVNNSRKLAHVIRYGLDYDGLRDDGSPVRYELCRECGDIIKNALAHNPK